MATIELPPYVASKPGQILISLDGFTFEPATIVVDELRDTVYDEDGVLVVILE